MNFIYGIKYKYVRRSAESSLHPRLATSLGFVFVGKMTSLEISDMHVVNISSCLSMCGQTC